MVESRGLYKLLRSGSNALGAHNEIFFVCEKILMEGYQKIKSVPSKVCGCAP